MVGSLIAVCRKLSAACRIAMYSRSTPLMRDSHSCLCGILPHLRQNLFQRLPRQWQRLGLAYRACWLCAGEHIMQVPPIVVIVKVGDVIVSRHEVEIDHAVGAWDRSPHGFE